MRTISFRDSISDPNLLGGVLAGPSYDLWRKVLLAVMGEITADEWRELQHVVGGRANPPSSRVSEGLFLVGRRGGKDRAASVLAAYLSALIDYSSILSRGERGVLLVIAPDTRQAKVQIDYVRGVFESSPILKSQVANQTADTVELTNGITIEVRAASFRRLRGVTAIGVIATEAAFWYTDEISDNADSAILNAVRPALATTKGMLLVITSPHGRRGEVYETYKRHFGPDSDPSILVVQGGSRDFNPTLPQSIVDRALERDPSAARAEFLGEFRSDVEGLLSLEAIQGVTILGRRELPPNGKHKYVGFVDPSGGSADSMTLAIAHQEGELAVLDALREVKPPFSPEAVTLEFAQLLKNYRVTRVIGDRYAGEWARERFRIHGITYQVSDKSASDLYRELLPKVNAGSVELLDHKRLLAQLNCLERRVSRTGRDTISHPPHGHDDIANAAAGALVNVVAADNGWKIIPWTHVFGGGAELSDAEHDARLRARGLKGRALKWHQRRPLQPPPNGST